MNQQQTEQQVAQGQGQGASGSRGTTEPSPSDIARRELVDWCERHGLPVPADRRGPRR